mmetsp:Transcript_34024/g.115404  ORF Transcript_34024/g.115404 Transcript_34024/m.115404 type:complete len:134 (-) Transcript_34024:7-408(-)
MGDSIDYVKFMVMYFGAYGVTMTISADYFWGPNSPVKMDYVAVPLDPIGEFFTRTVGICFLIMTLGKTHFGVSEAAWIKQTMLFNAGMIFFFYQNGNSDGAHFTPWLWQAQAGISAALTFWGKKTMDDMKLSF